MSGYRLELGVSGDSESLELTAMDDNAAKRQALLTLGDLMRDQALGGTYAVDLRLALFRENGVLIYEARVAAE